MPTSNCAARNLLRKPHVHEALVCNPRRNALLKEGSKSDKADARELADLLRAGMLGPVYHGLRALCELARSYQTISKDLNRVMNRLKALYQAPNFAWEPDRGSVRPLSSVVVRNKVRGRPSSAKGSNSMMVQTVNFARATCAALLCIVLCCCGGGLSCSDAPQPPMAGAAGEFQHILSYGQSLSLGERAVNRWPTDLTIPPEQDVGLMFASGVIPRGAMNALVPFADSTAPVDIGAWNIDTPGVTPLYGALLELKGLPGARIGSAAGRGATSIAGLSKGTAPYRRLISQVAAGRALSVGHYSVPAIIWMQGESDAGNPTYAAQLQQLFADLDADVRQAAGQAQTVQFFICLTAVRDIALAQQQAAAAMPNVHIACDTAMLPKSDGTHLTAQGSLAAGCSLGAHMRSLIPANEWNP